MVQLNMCSMCLRLKLQRLGTFEANAFRYKKFHHQSLVLNSYIFFLLLHRLLFLLCMTYHFVNFLWMLFLLLFLNFLSFSSHWNILLHNMSFYIAKLLLTVIYLCFLAHSSCSHLIQFTYFNQSFSFPSSLL